MLAMDTASVIFVLFTIPSILSITANKSPQIVEFRQFNNLLTDLKVFNETFWNKHVTEIEAIRKLAQHPIEVKNWQRLLNFYDALVAALTKLHGYKKEGVQA